MTDARTSIGGNNPPPVETHGLHINDLFDEAKGILDGEGVQTQADAEMVAKLEDMIREARKAADAQRKAEKRPYDDTVKAIQASWNPLLEKCDLAVETCKRAREPYQRRLEAEQQAAAVIARAEADRIADEARAAIQGAGNNLSSLSAGEAMLKEAQRADRDAAKLEKAKPHIAGVDRNKTLRTVYAAEITDMKVFGKWAWEHRRSEYEGFLADLAEREARRGPVTIPGLNIITERKAA